LQDSYLLTVLVCSIPFSTPLPIPLHLRSLPIAVMTALLPALVLPHAYYTRTTGTLTGCTLMVPIPLRTCPAYLPPTTWSSRNVRVLDALVRLPDLCGDSGVPWVIPLICSGWFSARCLLSLFTRPSFGW
jgi:hypothetical protein